MSIKSIVDELIMSETPVIVFSKTFCPYCTRAKEILRKAGVQEKKMHVKELDEIPNTSEYQDYLQTISGGRTVPRIFINHKFFGGCSDLENALANNSLIPLLTSAGAL